MYLRYKEASRGERTIILNELCATCGYNRKYAIRLLKGYKRFTKPKPRKRGKPSCYRKEEILIPLRQIWLNANLPCSKRLQAILPLWLPGYRETFGALYNEVSNALLKISPATIDRLLAPVRIQYHKRGRSTNKPGTLLRNQIHPDQPMERIQTGVHRGLHRRALWRITLRHVYLYHLYRHRMDRATGLLGKK